MESVTWAQALPLWLLILVGAGVVALCVRQQFRLSRRLPVRKAATLTGLRFTAFVLLIIFAFNPAVVARRTQPMVGSVAILLDNSLSMGIVDGDRSRIAKAIAAVGEGPASVLGRLEREYQVRLYAFGDSVRSLSKEERGSLKAIGRASDLAAAMIRAMGGEEGSRPVGVLLFSDGNVAVPGDFEAYLKETKVPLIPVAWGPAGSYRDILIKDVKVPPVAFRGKVVTVELTLKSYGYQGIAVPVVLRREGKLLASQTVLLSRDEFQTTVSLSFTLEEIGHHILSLSVPRHPDEAVSSNNSVEFGVDVLRDKVRILMVSGAPSFNYRFLRAALKKDPSIDLLSFVILRTPSDVMNVPIQQQSLIPFPVETLFTKELNNFDLLIFDNFPYSLYFGTSYLERIKEFVFAGGGFAMMGGPTSFEDGGYAGTPIEGLLPVKLGGRYGKVAGKAMAVTTAGQTHSITRIAPGKDESLRLWSELPPVEGVNPVQVSAGGAVLLELQGDRRYPLMAAGSHGKGRVLALTTDQAWRWSFEMVGRGRGNQAYLRLIDQMVRWLVNDPSTKQVQLFPPQLSPGVDQEVGLRIRAMDDDFAPVDGATVSLLVRGPGGDEREVQGQPAGLPGEYQASLAPNKEGSYRIKAVVRHKGKILGEDEKVLVATPVGEELEDPSPRPLLLARLAAITGGKVVSTADEAIGLLRSAGPPEKAKILEERRLPLWGTVYSLLLITVVLGTEWFLRRKWGLA